MLETKAAMLDRLQSRAADIIAEEISDQQAIDGDLRQLILDRTLQLQADIELEMDQSEGAVETLREYLHTQIPILYDSLKQGISEREAIEESLSKRISDEFALI